MNLKEFIRHDFTELGLAVAAVVASLAASIALAKLTSSEKSIKHRGQNLN